MIPLFPYPNMHDGVKMRHCDGQEADESLQKQDR